MPKNTLEDLRNHLFQALENLSNPEQDLTEMDIKKSQQICNISKAILNTANTELKMARYVREEGLIEPFEKNIIRIAPRQN